MKFQEGRFLAKLRSPTRVDEKEFFLKVTFEEGHHYLYIDDGTRKLIDEDVRDWILNDVHLIRPLPPGDPPKFKHVRFIIKAQSEYGTNHKWERTSWEALEPLLKKFPGLLKDFVTDSNRRQWLIDFARRAKTMRNKSIFK